MSDREAPYHCKFFLKRIFWRGTSILRVEKDVVLGDIAKAAAGGKKQFVTQHFSASFLHEADADGPPAPARQIQQTSGMNAPRENINNYGK